MHDIHAYQLRSPPTAWGDGLLLWLTGVLTCLLVIPQRVFIPGDPAFLLSLGALAVWRWSWGGMHMIRALLYTRVVFPRRRARAERAAPHPSHVACVVMSWRIAPEENAAVFASILDDLEDFGVPATLVASISDPADVHILNTLLARRPRARIQILTCVQDGTGKRRAMADALAALRRTAPPRDGVTILMDGDSYIPRGTLGRCAPILLDDPRLGALTTDNFPMVEGNSWTREWYRVRMAQRHVYMSSLSLSERVLVLTGRWSLYRSEIALNPDFAAAVASDAVYHPRFGRIAMLTGEDKSTWRWVLERGWSMIYIPDTAIMPLESLPSGGFLRATTRLMQRWYGNMARGGARTLPLGPRRVGAFAWLVLLDQRISMWTSLSGLVFFSLAALLHDWRFAAIYLLWLLLSRTFQTLCLWLVSGRTHILFVFLLFYGQIVGAVIKIYAFFHPYAQKWTRQNISSSRIGASSSWLLTIIAMLIFVLMLAQLSNVASTDRRFDLDTADISAQARG